MKNIFLSLIAIVATMSINAQVVKVYNNGELTATYTNTATNHYKVVFEMAATGEGTVSESAGISGNKVQSVQLWENGPKWAVFNVGAKSVSEYGDYYCWGSTNATDYCKNTTDIQGTSYDTAKNIWGDNWQMPKDADFINLLSTTYTDGGVWKSADESGYGIAGLLVTGKGDYASNSVFFPASGIYKSNSGGLICQGTDGCYWASTPYTSSNVCEFYFRSVQKQVSNNTRDYGLFVRPVLKSSDVYTPVIKVYENGTLTATYFNTACNTYKAIMEEIPPVTGTAKANINGQEVDVKWVQLWEGGPKWAEYNLGATSFSEYGSSYSWGATAFQKKDNYTEPSNSNIQGTTDDTATNIWGDNWVMPTDDDFIGLFKKTLDSSAYKYTDGGVWKSKEESGYGVAGMLFTGKEGTIYSTTTLFLPATAGSYGFYWTSIHDDDDGKAIYFKFNHGDCGTNGTDSYSDCHVRAILKE